jgi:hypothetical protein
VLAFDWCRRRGLILTGIRHTSEYEAYW